MAEAVVSVALETLKDLLLEESRFLLGVGGEVKALRSQLKEMKYLLEDAERRQHESKILRNWIAEIRDLAYRAEDVILEYAVEVSSGGRSLERLLRRFPRVFNGCYSLRQLGSEISEIESAAARVTKSMQDYGVRRIINDNDKLIPNLEINECFVGMEGDLNRLVSLVVDDEHHRIISVWGRGGIGKTTIAKRVYNEMIEAKKFDCFAWVCITRQCEIRSVLEDVLEQLDPHRAEVVSSLSDTQLIEQLREKQRSKRCIVVFDDLWETSHWDHGLKHAFLVPDLNTKILVTTRQHQVAEIGFSLQLGLLNIDDAWELLKKKAFAHHSNIPEFASQEQLQRIGKEMVRKCGWLPLAISLLGGVLSNKHSMGEWELVNRDIYRDEGDEQKENQIHGVLDLSYEDLPYYLKSCFLYLGRLREDETIYSANLYRIWIAQAMITEENMRGNEETLMETAERYLSELASRCIVQVEIEDVIPRHKYRTCKLHDVVRELCLSKGKNEDFGVQNLDYRGGRLCTVLHDALLRTKTRHLAIHFKTELQVEHDEHALTREEETGKHLRSLEILGDIVGKTFDQFPPQSIVDFRKFKLLKSLVIVRFKFAERKLPREITNLVHLKYLRLQKCELDSLPSSISNLAFLDTLDLLLSRNVRVPDVLKKMFRLKHLLLPFYGMETIGNYRLKLDEGVDELESLIGFDSSVHELKCVARMKNLRRFTASICDNESLSTIINAIATKWNKLSYCTVSIKQGCQLTASEQGVLKLKQAFSCPNIYHLRVFVEVGKLLEECMSEIMSSRLVKLYMLECEIEDDPMGILGKLPCLTELYLDSRSFVGEAMTCRPSSFPCLKKLNLNRLPKLREWRVEKGGMPLLSQLRVHRCAFLKIIPSGFSCILSLQKLVISGMPELGKRVFESGDDFHKLTHVPSIIIY